MCKVKWPLTYHRLRGADLGRLIQTAASPRSVRPWSTTSPSPFYIDPALPLSVQQQAQDWLGTGDNLTQVTALDDLDLDAYTGGLIITHQRLSDHHQHFLRKSILYHPPVLVAGMGCKRGVPQTELQDALQTACQDANLAPASLAVLATADLKADELGLQQLAEILAIPLQIVERSQLERLAPHEFSPSAAQTKFDLPGVAEPCAIVVAGAEGKLIVPKRSFARCTVAIALEGGNLDE